MSELWARTTWVITHLNTKYEVLYPSTYRQQMISQTISTFDTLRDSLRSVAVSLISALYYFFLTRRHTKICDHRMQDINALIITFGSLYRKIFHPPTTQKWLSMKSQKVQIILSLFALLVDRV